MSIIGKNSLLDDVDLVDITHLALVLADQVLSDGFVELSHFYESISRPVHSFLDLLPLLSVGRLVTRKHVIMPGELVSVLAPW